LPYLSKISEVSLKHSLNFGIGFLYQGMQLSEQRIITKLYEAGAIQVIICPYKMCWEIEFRAKMVAI